VKFTSNFCVKIVSTLFFVRFRERSHKIKYLYSDEFYGSLKSTFSNDVLHHKVVQLKKKLFVKSLTFTVRG